MLAKALITDEDVLERVIADQQNTQTLNTEMQHPAMTNPTELVTHMKEMLDQGYTTEQILELHPEISAMFDTGGEQDGND